MPMGAINHNQGWNQINRWTVEKFMRDGGLLSEVYLMWMRWEMGWVRIEKGRMRATARTIAKMRACDKAEKFERKRCECRTKWENELHNQIIISFRRNRVIAWRFHIYVYTRATSLLTIAMAATLRLHFESIV